MESPSYGSYWSHPSRRHHQPTANRFPAYPVHHKPVDVAPKKASPKIVRIPVQFIESQSTRSDAALKIQKVFRGFLVRKSMNRIRFVSREVDEIERRISQSDVVDLLRRDHRERIRVNEALMSLLFKLDSVRGVDEGVRVCRKAVTRKAVQLQERIDAIVASDPDLQPPVTVKLEVEGNSECDFPDLDQPQSVEQFDDSAQIENQFGNSAQTEVGDEADGVEEPSKSQNEGDEESGYELKEVISENREDENKGNRELLEKMMEENGKMMKLMTQLSERNEAQTRMLNALSQRVEQLEKAFTCDRLRRKKMKKHNTTV